MSKKAWIIFVAVTVIVLGGLVFLSRGSQINVSDINEAAIIPASSANGNIADHVFGATDSDVTLIEYGDFQCPACGSAYPNIKALTEEYKDKMKFIFRNLPLTSIHPNARAAAAAAEAAGLQGKYWEVHDLLYENQKSWESATSDQRFSFYTSYAEQAGVKDMNKFKTDMESEAVTDKINFDLAVAKKIGASATPTLILNGKKIEADTWSSPEKFKAAIEEALK